jgi:hypothetical protein
MSDINKGPLDYHHILKRRRVSLERWADHEGIKTVADFLAFKRTAEKDGYFFDEEMVKFGYSLPEPVVVAPVVETAESAVEEAEVTELPRPSKPRKPKTTSDSST